MGKGAEEGTKNIELERILENFKDFFQKHGKQLVPLYGIVQIGIDEHRKNPTILDFMDNSNGNIRVALRVTGIVIYHSVPVLVATYSAAQYFSR